MIGRRRRPSGERRTTVSEVEATRARLLVEESREIVVVLDDGDRVIAASRRARESVDGLSDGTLFPRALLDGDRQALEVAYEVDGHRERLVYLNAPGDLAAYEELRAGFTAAVSHELRTPLARLLALLEGAGLPNADTPDLIAQARLQVEQIGELIDDVLFLSELESGRAVVSLGSSWALPVLEQVLAALADRAHDADVTVALECPASISLPLRQRMLEIVAKNLAENAIRHAGLGATLRLTVREEPGAALLEASDDGHGVSEDDLPRLFERFYRGDRSRSSPGSGLGLAIVKHVVGAAGGSVEAAANEHGGLTIRCHFPRS